MNSVYRVQPGDNLTKIAQKYGISVPDLLKLNPQIDNPDIIAVSQPLNVPLAVVEGEQQSGAQSASDETLPPWYLIARNELEAGVEEVAGALHNPRIVEYHQTTTLAATDDETSWCSSFVNWCVENSGRTGTKSAAARSWLNWGLSLTKPRLGCIVVLKRGQHPWQGHVGFYAGMSGSHILVLGGNQGNEVNISSYHSDRLLSYRWESE